MDSYNISRSFLDKQKKRFIGITSSVFILLILGAWVSSTAGGQYNQGCSIGFPNGWPQCQGSFLPSIDGEPGILVQMLHRFGAGVVGVVLILSAARVRVVSVQQHGGRSGVAQRDGAALHRAAACGGSGERGAHAERAAVHE